MRNDNLQQYINLRRELSQEREQLARRLAEINQALGELPAADQSNAAPAPDTGNSGGAKRGMSAAARARIAEAQRRRWAAARKAGGAKPAAAKPAASSGKRQMSPAARKAIAEAARKRWAAAKAAGKNRL